MSDPLSPEQIKVLEFFRQKKKMMTARDVAAGLKIEPSAAKKLVSELVKSGALEFTSFGGATFVKLPDAPAETEPPKV